MSYRLIQLSLQCARHSDLLCVENRHLPLSIHHVNQAVLVESGLHAGAMLPLSPSMVVVKSRLPLPQKAVLGTTCQSRTRSHHLNLRYSACTHWTRSRTAQCHRTISQTCRAKWTRTS